MTASVSRRLNILFIDYSVFHDDACFARLYVRGGISLTCGKHLPDLII